MGQSGSRNYHTKIARNRGVGSIFGQWRTLAPSSRGLFGPIRKIDSHGRFDILLEMKDSDKISIRRLITLALFSIAFAYIEAVVVVYLRAIFYPDGFTFPIINFLVMPGAERYVLIEIGREAATMVLILTASWLMVSNWRHRLAYFLIIFAVWDIFYYVWLKLLLN